MDKKYLEEMVAFKDIFLPFICPGFCLMLLYLEPAMKLTPLNHDVRGWSCHFGGVRRGKTDMDRVLGDAGQRNACPSTSSAAHKLRGRCSTLHVTLKLLIRSCKED